MWSGGGGPLLVVWPRPAPAAAVLLAYPLWVTFEGPAHLSGLVWPNLPPGTGGIVLGNIWHPQVMTTLRQTMQGWAATKVRPCPRPSTSVSVS